MHPDPIGTKDQNIHSGQFRTKVRFPFSSCVITFSIPNQNKIAVKIMHRTVVRITDGFFSFSGRRSVTSDRLTSSPSRHASAAAAAVGYPRPLLISIKSQHLGHQTRRDLRGSRRTPLSGRPSSCGSPAHRTPTFQTGGRGRRGICRRFPPGEARSM